MIFTDKASWAVINNNLYLITNSAWEAGPALIANEKHELISAGNILNLEREDFTKKNFKKINLFTNNTLESKIKKSFFNVLESHHLISNLSTALIYENNTLVTHMLRDGPLLPKVAAKFTNNKNYAIIGDKFWIAESGNRTPYISINNNNYSLIPIGDKKPFIDTYKQLISSERKANKPLFEKNQPIKVDFGIQVISKGSDYDITVNTKPFVMRFNNENYLFDAVSANYLVSLKNNQLFFHDEPKVTEKYDHPFVWANRYFCFSGRSRFKNIGLYFSKVIDVDEKSISYLMAFPGVEFIKTVHSGYTKGVTPVRYLSEFQSKKISNDELIRRGLRIYECER